jgi:hypothetical protein
MLSRIWKWLTADIEPVPPEIVEQQLFNELWW